VKKGTACNFQIVVENAGGNFSAYSPDLPGCIATGKTRAGARRNMQAAIRMHLKGLKEDGTKAVKCGSCGTAMRKRPEKRMGLRITIQECPRCGKRLISMEDAIRPQERTRSSVRDIDTAVAAGDLKCICGRIAKRVGDLEHNGMLFWGWKCECGETLIDPYMANMYLKGRKKNGGRKTTTIAEPSIGSNKAEVRIREIQKLLGAEARRNGITRKALLKALERERKREWAD
jgi:predicted RNase H-like HicB family nuclease